MTALFQWTTNNGRTIKSPIPPTPEIEEFNDINELVLLRPTEYFEKEINRIKDIKGYVLPYELNYLKNQPIECHNIYCLEGQLPPNLTIFRANDCRIWHWPKFPPTIVEIEMNNSCVLSIPDLSALTACTILMLNDGIVADCVGPLPPRLEVLGLTSCSISSWTIGTAIPETLDHISFDGNPSKGIKCIPLEIQQRFLRINRQHQPLPAFFQDHEPLAILPEEPLAILPQKLRGKNIAHNSQNVHESGFQQSTINNIKLLINYRLKRLSPMSQETHSTFKKTTLVSIRSILGLTKDKSIWSQYVEWLDSISRLDDGTYIKPLSIKEYFMKHPTAQEVFEFLIKSTVGEQLFSFMRTPYSLFGTTFIEIAIRTVEKILDMDPNGDEGEKRCTLLQRLKEEVADGVGHCTNGMIVRLTNVFVGIDDAFEMIASPAAVLGGRIPILLEKLRKDEGWVEGAEPSTYWLKIIEEIIKDMREMDLDKAKWNNWISEFVDNYKNELVREKKVGNQSIVRLNEDELNALNIREQFLKDQIRIWVGLGNFE